MNWSNKPSSKSDCSGSIDVCPIENSKSHKLFKNFNEKVVIALKFSIPAQRRLINFFLPNFRSESILFDVFCNQAQ